MHRSLRLALIAMPLIAIACGDDQSTAPPPPHVYVASTNTISQQIDALYPTTLGHRDAAQAKWRALQDAIAKDKPNQRSKLMHLIDWTLKREKEGVLSDPNGAEAPSTRLAVSILTASLYQAVYPDAPAPPIVEEGVDIGAGVVEPTTQTIIVTEQSQAGGEFEAGTWSQPVLVTFVEQADPPPGGSGPLPAGRLKQYPKFYEITAFPNDPTQKDIRIGICHVTDEESPYFPPEPHSQLRVARKKDVGEGSELQILERVEVADFLHCTDVEAEDPIIIGAAQATGLRGLALRTLGRAVKGLASIVAPRPLYAIDQGIGGRHEMTADDAEPEGAFSTFGLVDVSPPPADAAACASPVPGYTTYPSVAEAVAATSPGGTTYICDGTHVVDTVWIRKPMTVRSFPGGSVTIRMSEAVPSNFFIDTVPSGTVRITGLRFETDYNISIWSQGQYDQVLVDSNEFRLAPGTTHSAVYAARSSVPGAKVTVRNSSFEGGPVGTFTHGGNIDVFNSTFADHSFSAIQYQGAGRGRAQYNTLAGCGPFGCIRAILASSMEILNNSMSATQGKPIAVGIIADTGLVTIEDNQVIGYGTVPNPAGGMSSDTASYPIRFAGIFVGRSPSAHLGSLSRNRIMGAYRGVFASTMAITGANNTIDSTYVALSLGSRAVTITQSDIAAYHWPFTGANSALHSLTCDFWGTAAGPINVPAGTSSSVYAPWATGPIANGAGGPCDGGTDLGEGFIGSAQMAMPTDPLPVRGQKTAPMRGGKRTGSSAAVAVPQTRTPEPPM